MDSLGFHFCQSQDFFLIQNVCTRPGPTQLQCKEGAFSVVVKQLLCEVHHSRLCGAEVKNEWSYMSSPVFLPDMHNDYFTFPLIALDIEFPRTHQSLFFKSILFSLVILYKVKS